MSKAKEGNVRKNPQDFSAFLNPQIKNVLSILYLDFSITFVGGAVRDFFLSSQNQSELKFKDIDIELRPKSPLDVKAALSKLDDFAKKIKQLGYSIKILPFLF